MGTGAGTAHSVASCPRQPTWHRPGNPCTLVAALLSPALGSWQGWAGPPRDAGCHTLLGAAGVGASSCQHPFCCFAVSCSFALVTDLAPLLSCRLTCPEHARPCPHTRCTFTPPSSPRASRPITRLLCSEIPYITLALLCIYYLCCTLPQPFSSTVTGNHSCLLSSTTPTPAVNAPMVMPQLRFWGLFSAWLCVVLPLRQLIAEGAQQSGKCVRQMDGLRPVGGQARWQDGGFALPWVCLRLLPNLSTQAVELWNSRPQGCTHKSCHAEAGRGPVRRKGRRRGRRIDRPPVTLPTHWRIASLHTPRLLHACLPPWKSCMCVYSVYSLFSYTLDAGQHRHQQQARRIQDVVGAPAVHAAPQSCTRFVINAR